MGEMAPAVHIWATDVRWRHSWAAMVAQPPAWWEYLLLPLGSIFGAWGTWAWFKKGQNVFDIASDAETSRAEKAKSQ